MNSESIRTLLHKYIPLAAVDYCVNLWNQHPFSFKVKKAGDFSYRPGRIQQITINHDLHPYLFLMTYIHEVAHLQVHLTHGHRIEAHGNEWKKVFRELMAPVLDSVIFPPPLLSGLKIHMANPKASAYSDAALMALFRMYDERAIKSVLLSSIPEGSSFNLRGKWFKKGKVRRTRVLCREVKTKRDYLVPTEAEIDTPYQTALHFG